MIDDLWHGYDVSSTLTSNFSPSISTFSRRGDPRWNMVSGNLRFQGVHLHSVPLCPGSTDFCFDFHFLRRNRMRRESKGREYHSQRSIPRKLWTWHDSRLFAIDGFRSSSEANRERDSLILLRLYCFRWRGEAWFKIHDVLCTSFRRKRLFRKSFIVLNPNSSIMIVQYVSMFD